MTLSSVIGMGWSSILLRNRGTKACLEQINEAFPGSLPNKELVQRVFHRLGNLGFAQDNTLLATCLGNDRVANATNASEEFVKEFVKFYGENYAMGGLGGFPWRASEAFQSMAPQIRVIGNALLVFAPRVEVDNDGKLGLGASTDTLMAAYHKVAETKNNDDSRSHALEASFTTVHDQAEYAQLCDALLPYTQRLEDSPEPIEELVYACYDAQKDLITDIVERGCGSTNATEAQVAVLGGIQISTPSKRCTDYFIPLSLEMYNGQGEKTKDLWL